MGQHAEHIAGKFDLSRADQDAYSAQSQARAAKAIEQGAFDDEIVSVNVPGRRKESVVTADDECVRPNTTTDDLAKLRTVFDTEGTVTAGNASTLSDGAAAVVIVDEQVAAELEGPWRARIVASHTSGTEPRDLFIAPVTAVRGVLAKAGWATSDVDYYEINEAFAAQMLACVRQLELDMEQVNVLGGGISIGHPIGASGARVLVTLLNVLTRNNAKRGVAALCLGGGNAVAMAVECE
jgi:acetyl-CoA C-acetyltransferase